MIFTTKIKAFSAYFHNIGSLVIMAAIYFILHNILEKGLGLVYYYIVPQDLSSENSVLITLTAYFVLSTLFYFPMQFGITRGILSIANGGKIKISDVFFFFRGIKHWLKAVAFSVIFTILQFATQELSFMAQLQILPPVLCILFGFVILLVLLKLFLVQYIFAENPETSILTALKLSFINMRGNLLKLVGFLLCMVIEVALLYIPEYLIKNQLADLIAGFAIDAVIMPLIWVQFAYFAYNILHLQEKVEALPDSENEAECDEQTDGEIPYEKEPLVSEGFFILTQDLEDIDIREALESSCISDEMKNYYDVRKALKKLYNELVLEIGFYQSYAGGRSAELSSRFEYEYVWKLLTLKISRGGDEEKFLVEVTIADE